MLTVQLIADIVLALNLNEYGTAASREAFGTEHRSPGCLSLSHNRREVLAYESARSECPFLHARRSSWQADISVKDLKPASPRDRARPADTPRAPITPPGDPAPVSVSACGGQARVGDSRAHRGSRRRHAGEPGRTASARAARRARAASRTRSSQSTGWSTTCGERRRRRRRSTRFTCSCRACAAPSVPAAIASSPGRPATSSSSGPTRSTRTASSDLYESARTALTAGDADDALALLQQAEVLWRGQPLADFTYEPFAQATIARLEELRVSAREELIEAQLALGRHDEVVSELEALVREHPFRERARGQLMLALYRCGRQAQALDAFQQARRALVEELAVEPGEALRELEQAILRQDPSLQPPATKARTREEPARSPAPPEPDREQPALARGVPDQPPSVVVRKTVTVLVARLSGGGETDPERMRRAVAEAREQADEIVWPDTEARSWPDWAASWAGCSACRWFGRTTRCAPSAPPTELRHALGADDPREPVVDRAYRRSPPARSSPSRRATCSAIPRIEPSALAQAAPPGEILVGDTTRRLAFNAIHVEPALDGTAWRLLGLVTQRPRRRRDRRSDGRA